ncbi:MAG TPA: tRNA (adenosine(37)-N6)-threonylcarbamoyltransferase complex transferase subunit TsaD [Kiritimatiellia bacterium]|nr:tRNA (adenosine(37)-N6)-threonylcarbamoyltransferase complex transferase subunit TsaD [Kiritimatiellia bacterium]HRZ12042.1 tRNA (adenosine(37)-N6)-threonylcarbamoyltransferase complex transferase subunit TsaD [Kiritimatiellia bacterium]HSA19627.1 tRNA (adenosine(37)-N6)-threonylcarbamoyltransferase complex transferase subunit TsaD [Kiritimatiellia bacterium]
MNVLGIETSCDETAAAVVADGWKVLSNCIYSQVASHRPYGGVVPEIASRQHVEILPGILREAIGQSGLGWDDLDAFAVTRGPGLASSLLVGLSAAQSLALRQRRPLIPVNHVEAHLYSLFLPEPPAAAPPPAPPLPMLVLMVSGGHTALVRFEGLGRYRWLGQSLDDAAGEALDKGANLMGLGYPGGPAIEQAAAGGDPEAISFSRTSIRASPRTGDLDPDLCFSFSGLKTALLYLLRRQPELLGPDRLRHLAASFQEAVFNTLLHRAEQAMEKDAYASFGCVGGVLRNRRLRARIEEAARRRRLPLRMAPPSFCTDNAAMVAGLAGATGGPAPADPAAVEIRPDLRLSA